MFLFARWISTCYADTRLDKNGKCEYDKDFDTDSALSVLNSESGTWWRRKLEHFNEVIYTKYTKNKTVKDTVAFLTKEGKP